MTAMTDGEIRALAHRFFDAIEQRDTGAIAALYHDDLQFWFNATDKTSTKAENLAAMTAGNPRHRRRTYNDRIIHTFAGGFVIQYTLNIKHHDGKETALFPALVALVHEGQILRIDEYIDSGKFSAPLPGTPAADKAAAKRKSKKVSA